LMSSLMNGGAKSKVVYSLRSLIHATEQDIKKTSPFLEMFFYSYGLFLIAFFGMFRRLLYMLFRCYLMRLACLFLSVYSFSIRILGVCVFHFWIYHNVIFLL